MVHLKVPILAKNPMKNKTNKQQQQQTKLNKHIKPHTTDKLGSKYGIHLIKNKTQNWKHKGYY